MFIGVDESGCEADMAEGGAEEESGDMLGPATAPVHQSPSALNVKTEVSVYFNQFIFMLNVRNYHFQLV